MERLVRNPGIVIFPADKGSATVAMDRIDSKRGTNNVLIQAIINYLIVIPQNLTELKFKMWSKICTMKWKLMNLLKIFKQKNHARLPGAIYYPKYTSVLSHHQADQWCQQMGVPYKIYQNLGTIS